MEHGAILLKDGLVKCKVEVVVSGKRGQTVRAPDLVEDVDKPLLFQVPVHSFVEVLESWNRQERVVLAVEEPADLDEG